jgi:hypothetical protein
MWDSTDQRIENSEYRLLAKNYAKEKWDSVSLRTKTLRVILMQFLDSIQELKA